MVDEGAIGEVVIGVVDRIEPWGVYGSTPAGRFSLNLIQIPPASMPMSVMFRVGDRVRIVLLAVFPGGQLFSASVKAMLVLTGPTSPYPWLMRT